MSRPDTRITPPLSLVCLACLSSLSPAAMAQAADTSLPGVSVSAPAPRQSRASITGLGDLPAWQTPAQALSVSQPLLRDAGVTRLADLTKLDASATDAYNPVGYWDSLSVRGFTLSNAQNYRREGLPISAETRLALDNKSAVEVLKGTSGIQAGNSAPGGLVNLLVKRPDVTLRELTLGVNDRGGVLTALDLSDRFGAQREFGLRVNAAAETLRPTVQRADGNRRLLALAGDWKLNADTRLEAEFEHSQHSQVSVPGFSLLGGALPSAKSVDPTINLNAQAWSRPVEMQGNTGSLRWTQNWGAGWRSQLSYGEQRLQSTDRGAFPFGCSANSTYDPSAYCSDGSFDLYDFRSPGEHRRTRAWNATLNGQVDTGPLRHDLSFGLLRSRHDADLQQAMYTGAGGGNVSGNLFVAEIAPALDYANTVRSERSTELSIVDALSHNGPWRAWVGLRHTQLQRDTALTDGTGSASRDQDLTTGWAAVGYQLAEQTQAYVSWGQGLETFSAQNTPIYKYDNSGAALPVRRSRQVEAGLKGAHGGRSWGANLFQIHRPVADRVGNSFLADGEALHQGVEGSWQVRNSQWQAALSGMLLDTERRGSQRTDLQLNGKPAVNVPEHTLKASVAWRVPASVLPALTAWLQADVVHEGPRAVTADNRVRLSSWTRTDASLRASQSVGGHNVMWRLNVHNLFNLRNWREAPTYADHVYLMPMAARSVSASATIDF